MPLDPLETYVTFLVVLLVACACIALVFGKIRAAVKFLLVGLVSIVVVAVVAKVGFVSEAEKAFPYILGFIGLLIGLRLLREFLAVFVGKGAADTTIGTLLALVIRYLFLALVWPLKILRRLFNGL